MDKHMQKPGKMFPFSKVLLIGLALWSWGCAPGPELVPSPQPTASSVPTAFMPPQKSWIMVDLPSDATQLQYGGEVYRLACSACHAYDGQGLTAAWRATWAPTDQNCWQSKCHGPNHPPDGFELPVAPLFASAITSLGSISPSRSSGTSGSSTDVA